MKVVGNILASVVSFVYFFVLIAFAFILFASNVFSANYYTNILNNVELSEIKLGDLEDLGLSEFEGYSSDDTLEDVLVGVFTEAGLSKNDAEAIINNEKINETVGKLISDIAMYMVNQENVPQIAENDIKEIFANDDIADLLEEQPTDEELEELTREINIELEKIFKEELSDGERAN